MNHVFRVYRPIQAARVLRWPKIHHSLEVRLVAQLLPELSCKSRFTTVRRHALPHNGALRHNETGSARGPDISFYPEGRRLRIAKHEPVPIQSDPFERLELLPLEPA